MDVLPKFSLGYRRVARGRRLAYGPAYGLIAGCVLAVRPDRGSLIAALRMRDSGLCEFKQILSPA